MVTPATPATPEKTVMKVIELVIVRPQEIQNMTAFTPPLPEPLLWARARALEAALLRVRARWACATGLAT